MSWDFALDRELADAAEELRQLDMPSLAEAVTTARERIIKVRASDNDSSGAFSNALPDESCNLYPVEVR